MKRNIKNKLITFYLMIGMVLLVIGFSYAFFIYNKTGLYTHTITGGKMKVIYDETTGNNITIENAYPLTDKEAETKSLEFEFTITGYNESDKNVYYAIEIDHGEDVSEKNRFLDQDMKLSLYENDEEVFENEIFNNLDNQDIYYGYFRYGTSSELPTINEYKMKIWINDNVVISDTEEEIEGKNVYATDEFSNSYANFKVNVRADLTYDAIGYLTYDANGGEFTPKPTSLATNRVTMQKPVMKDKGFIGWSTTKDGEVEYYSGDSYIDGERVLYAVYDDTINVMSDLTTFDSYKSNIKEVYFINEEQEVIDEYANEVVINGGVVIDLTHDNYLDKGNVTGILEYDILYIMSDGTTYLSNCKEMFKWFNVNNIYFDNADTSMVTDMSYMFFECEDLFELDLSSFNTINVLDMSYMFSFREEYANPVITEINVSNFNTSNVVDMNNMFSYQQSIEYLDLSNFDTSNVANMDSMFRYCSDLITIDMSNFNTENVTDMSYIFRECFSLETLDLSNFNTSNVVNMQGMFFDCSSLINVDLSFFDTSKVESMSEMFRVCSSLTTLDVSDFNTENVTDMSYMFDRCSSLTTLDISNFDTSNVEYMYDLFYDCSDLIKLDISNFDTSNVEYMYGLFYNCSSLIKLDVSNFDTSNVTDMHNIFYNCSSLNEIDLSTWNTSNVTNMSGMFSGCSNLSRLNLSHFNTSNLKRMCSSGNSSYYYDTGMFYNCTNLTYLDISSFDFDTLEYYSFAFYGMPTNATIYVGTVTDQNNILDIDSGYRPAWTTSNIIVKG